MTLSPADSANTKHAAKGSRSRGHHPAQAGFASGLQRILESRSARERRESLRCCASQQVLQKASIRSS